MRTLSALGLRVHDEFFDDRRVQIPASGHDLADRFHQLGRRAVFGEIAGSAGVHRTPCELIGRVHAEHQHRQRRPLAPQILQQIESARSWQA